MYVFVGIYIYVCIYIYVYVCMYIKLLMYINVKSVCVYVLRNHKKTNTKFDRFLYSCNI